MHKMLCRPRCSRIYSLGKGGPVSSKLTFEQHSREHQRRLQGPPKKPLQPHTTSTVDTADFPDEEGNDVSAARTPGWQ